MLPLHRFCLHAHHKDFLLSSGHSYSIKARDTHSQPDQESSTTSKKHVVHGENTQQSLSRHMYRSVNALMLSPLHKAEEALMPDHRQRALLLPEAEEVVDQGIHHAVGQGISLVQQHPNEEGVDA